ncbi:MAG: TolC family protein [Pseudomonadota bacterium]|nr:TolC family protein [Pseudomonadota bacterium]
MKLRRHLAVAGVPAALLLASLSLTGVSALAGTPAGMPVPTAMPAAADVQRLTLEQALALAEERNLQIELSGEQIDVARSALAEMRGALGPNVRLTASQSNQTVNLVAQGFPKPGAGPSLFPVLDGPFNAFDARLVFSQSIFDASRSHQVHASERQVAEAEHQRAATAEQLASAVELAYIAVQQQVAEVDAAEGNLKLSHELLTQAQDQRKAGIATGVDVARAETRVAQDEYALTAAHNARGQGLLRLKRLLGLPAATAIELASPLAYQERTAPTAEAAVARAEAERQELRMLDERVAAAEESLVAAGDQRLPVVSVQAGLGPSGSTPTQTVYLTRSIGVGVSVPLFTSGQIDAQRDRASSALRTARLQREDARRQVEEDVHLALLSLATATEQVVAARTSLALGERLLDLSRDRFVQGVADNLEVLDALNATTTARSRLIDAIAAHTAARANLDAALGTARSFNL